MAFGGLDGHFAGLYARGGRPSIAPERLIRAQLLQVLYSVRSERMLMEQLEYNLLFRWFVGLGMDDVVWAPTTFTKNRDRLLEAWAGQKSFKRKDQPQEPPDDPGNPTVNFHGERRSNQTHQSTTDPDSRLFKKATGHEAKLSYLGEVLM